MEKKSALHFGRQGDAGPDPQPLGQDQAEAIEELGLSRIGADHTPQTEISPVVGWQHDVRALDAAEFFMVYPKDGPMAGYYYHSEPVVPVYFTETIGPSLARAIVRYRGA